MAKLPTSAQSTHSAGVRPARRQQGVTKPTRAATLRPRPVVVSHNPVRVAENTFARAQGVRYARAYCTRTVRWRGARMDARCPRAARRRRWAGSAQLPRAARAVGAGAGATQQSSSWGARACTRHAGERVPAPASRPRHAWRARAPASRPRGGARASRVPSPSSPRNASRARACASRPRRAVRASRALHQGMISSFFWGND
jgi:hypothetical protein